jgi:4-amino-4-deoxy-L-arabinose transferase-like glycosyltransferase
MIDHVQAIIRYHAGLLAALIVAVALKAFILVLDAVPFNADEAVVALMARHILQGERPVFFYGQAYLGSTDAWLVAGAFQLLGQQVVALRVVQAALYLGVLVATYLLGLKIYGDRWTAAAAALLLAIPPVLVTLYTTATLGGYGETLLFGSILLLWTLRLRDGQCSPLEWALFGVLAGFGFYTFGLLGVYLLPMGLALVLRPESGSTPGQRLRAALSRPSLIRPGSALIGFILGSTPWWWATLFGAATVSELGGSAIAGASRTGWLASLALRAFSLLVLGSTVVMGMRPPWAIRWLALPLAPLAIAMFIGAGVRAVQAARTQPPVRLLAGLCLTLCAAFLVTPFGNDPSGRYFLPLAPPLTLFTADLLRRIRQDYPRAAHVLLAGLLAFNLWGNLDSAFRMPPGITTQFDPVAQVDQRDLPRVIAFLTEQGETRGYTNYWVSFPAAFLSREQIILQAALPYHEDFRHTTRDDRYAAYAAMVSESDRAAYVTTLHPALDERLRASFESRGVRFSEMSIGDFHIFYGLSRKVTPQEIGLGVNCCP